MNFAEDLAQRVRASYPALYIVAREDWRCAKEVERVAKELGVPFHQWTVTKGWDNNSGTTDPLAAIKAVVQREGVYCLINFHRYLDDPEMIQTVKDTVQVGKLVGQTLCFVSNVYKLPDELMDDVSRLEFGLPDRDLLSERIDFILDSDNVRGVVPTPDNGQRDKLVEAALGMTTWEAENAFAISILRKGRLDPKIVSEEKAKVVSKGGVLEFYEPQVGMADVGGLDNLKAWLTQRKDAFSKEAREFGLPEPRGILLVGIPGCGKSLAAKAISSEWGIPLLRFDVGRLFQGLVGASEENTRRAIQTAEAVAPAVLWIDEIEKSMAGMGGSGSTDSGVTARVFGNILSWMQERKRPVFVVATANQVQNLPPELLRAGRFDEVFAIDLPSDKEREEILSIHLKKRRRDPASFNLRHIAKEAMQFSGAELEAVVVKGLFNAFAQRRELEDGDLMYAITATVPLAVTRREEIDILRQWTKTRAIPASSAVPPEVSTLDEATARRKVRITSVVEEINEGDTP